MKETYIKAACLLANCKQVIHFGGGITLLSPMGAIEEQWNNIVNILFLFVESKWQHKKTFFFSDSNANNEYKNPE